MFEARATAVLGECELCSTACTSVCRVDNCVQVLNVGLCLVDWHK